MAQRFIQDMNSNLFSFRNSHKVRLMQYKLTVHYSDRISSKKNNDSTVV